MMESCYHPQRYVVGMDFLSFWFSYNTVVAKAVETGAGAALIHIDFTAGAGEAPATVTAEA